MLMKKILFFTFMLSASLCMNAESVVPMMYPVWWDLKSDCPLVAPLEDVSVEFDHTIKLMDSPKLEVLYNGEVVAESISAEVYNGKTLNRNKSKLVAHFGKQYLPKGRTYNLVLREGAVGWDEEYDGVQVVNVECDMSFSVPETLGKPQIFADTEVFDSKTINSVLYPYETAVIGDAKFKLYRDGEEIGQYPLEIINWPVPTSQIYPAYSNYIPFEMDVPYSLVLPAGSLGSIYRDDITNEEVRIDFKGCYVEPTTPFNYIWCSWFTNHSDILGEITFTYDRPIALTDDASVQLWEGDYEILVKEVMPKIETKENNWLLIADFGGIPLTSEKGYVICIPDGALISADGSGTSSERGQLNVGKGSGIDAPTLTPLQHDSSVYDIFGRKVQHLIPGSIYICNGKKFVHKN